MKATVTPEEIRNARKHTCNVCGYYGIWTDGWGYYEKWVGTKYNLGEEQFTICSKECDERQKKEGLVDKWRKLKNK